MNTNLSKTETKTLAAAETILRRNLESFLLVGEALAEIRDARLYRATHETFEAYCADRWDFSRQRAHQLIASSQTAAAVSTIVDTRPARESHVRPLLAVPEGHRAEVWQMAVDASPVDADGKPLVTARIVQEAVDRWHDGRKADPPEPQVIDVESRPIEPEHEDLIVADWEEPARPPVVPPACPNCGATEWRDDDSGFFCRSCLEPLGESEEAPVDREKSPDDLVMESIEEMVREQWCGRLAVAAARLEALVDRLREGKRCEP